MRNEDRGPALQALVTHVRQSDGALWAFDFPFGLPVEVMPAGANWFDQLDWVRGWGEDAYGLGVECLRRAQAVVCVSQFTADRRYISPRVLQMVEARQ